MYKTTLPLSLAMSLWSGCAAHVRVQPAIADVHRVAVVSTYANKDVYNVENPDAGAALALLKAVLPATDAGELDKITAHAMVTVVDSLSPSFEVVDPQTLLTDPTYSALDASGTVGEQPQGRIAAALAKAAQGMVATPPGMVAIPVDSVLTPRGTIELGDDKKAREAATAELGVLAGQLNVDAVAIVQLDLGYQPSGWFSFSLFGNTSSRARPSVATTIAMIDKNGEVVLDTPLQARGEGKRYRGKGVWMLKNGTVDLTQRSDKVVGRFNGAIDAAGGAFEKRLAKQLEDLAAGGADAVAAAAP